MEATPRPAPVYVVFGATGGIGRELCRRLRARSGGLVLAARRAAPLDALARELDAVPVAVDATRAEDVDACVARAVERFGRIDGVASCVGSLLLKPAHRTEDAEWVETVTTNLTSSFWIVRAAARAMLATGGAIVLTSAAAARVGVPSHDAIAAAKAGVIGLVRGAGATYANHGIRLNGVAPGLVRTPLTAALTQEPVVGASVRMHPLGRIGEPADVASAIAWLLAPEQAWITGQVLGVDGGLATLRGRPAR